MSRPPRVVFRLPAVALVFPIVLLLCVIPLAGLGDWWLLMYLIPVLGLVWMLVTWTAADPTGVRVRGMQVRRSLTWDDMQRLELSGSRWVVAIDRAGRRTRLPMVLTRDLPRLAAASGGAFQFDPPGSAADRRASDTLETRAARDGTSADGTSADGTSADGTSADGTSADGTSADGRAR